MTLVHPRRYPNDPVNTGRRDPVTRHLLAKYGHDSIVLLLNRIAIRLQTYDGTVTPEIIDQWVADLGGPRVKPEPRASVVYYALFNGLVKIGVTVDIEKRLKEIPHDELLVTETGDRHREHARHVEFQDLHYRGEWFRYEGRLVTHVERLIREQGTPAP